MLLIHLFMDEGFEIFDLALDNIWCRVILSPRLDNHKCCDRPQFCHRPKLSTAERAVHQTIGIAGHLRELCWRADNAGGTGELHGPRCLLNSIIPFPFLRNWLILY